MGPGRAGIVGSTQRQWAAGWWRGLPGHRETPGGKMINDAQVVLSGYVAKEPQFRLTSNGNPTATLRVGYTPRRVDRDSGEWTDGATSFVTVVCWRTLAHNVATCLRKGEPVLVRGRLQVRPYEKEGVPRLAVEIEASSVGHDLARGVAMFQRSRRAPGDATFGRSGLPGASPAGASGPAVGNGPADGGSAGPPPHGFFAETAVSGLAQGGPPAGAEPAGARGEGDGPVAAGPAEDGPVPDELLPDGPVPDGPVPDGPVADGPVADGPVADGPVADGPVADGGDGAAQPSSVTVPF
jgi:single-strand DNA-binding protein